MTPADLHRRVVEHIAAQGVRIRTELAGTLEPGEEARYCALDDHGDPTRLILVLRPVGGLEVAFDESSLEVSPRFFDLADPLREALNLAHELGHDRLAQDSGDPTAHTLELNRLTKKATDHRDGLPVSVPLDHAGASAIYSEEVDAWSIGEATLKALGFADWPAFHALRDASLATYADGLRACCPSWSPPGPPSA